jgi:hypothetical protein
LSGHILSGIPYAMYQVGILHPFYFLVPDIYHLDLAYYRSLDMTSSYIRLVVNYNAGAKITVLWQSLILLLLSSWLPN